VGRTALPGMELRRQVLKTLPKGWEFQRVLFTLFSIVKKTSFCRSIKKNGKL
jgi:hypothetical protein